MRLKSEIWVKAYIRRCASAGLQAVVVRHGDDDAGAIYIRINRLDGSSLLFGPAPAGLDQLELERRWSPAIRDGSVDDGDVDTFLERETGFDPDLWVVEVESREGVHFLDDWLAR